MSDIPTKSGGRHGRVVTARNVLAFLCLLPLAAWARDPAGIYTVECQGCHLADGSGGLTNIPPLNNSVARFLEVPGGREYLVQVPGVALSSLSDQQVADVLNWMVTTFGPLESARQFVPYTFAEVALLRKRPLTEISRRRAELLSLMN
ncbi:MAG: cytochrome c [Halioglobus sp.]